MMTLEQKQTFYTTDFIKDLHCDICKREITNEKLFKLETSFVELTHEGKYLSQVFEDENNDKQHICSDCIQLIRGLSKDTIEYINDRLDWTNIDRGVV